MDDAPQTDDFGQGGEVDPRRLLPTLLVMAAACVVATVGVVAVRAGGDGPAEAVAGVDGATSPRNPATAARILADWDRQRARAWARGDVDALTDLYVPDSRTGSVDVAMLRHWTARGLRVVGLQTQVLRLDVIAQKETRLSVLVTDRVVGGEAVGPVGRVGLPSDRASTRRITLRNVSDRWLVAEVRDQATQ